MKLHNYTLSYISASLLLIISVWATVFYFGMLDEIYDGIDDSLENYKTIVTGNIAGDSTLLRHHSFDEGNYTVTEVPRRLAVSTEDAYKDTVIYQRHDNDAIPVRMLTTVFRGADDRYYLLKVISSTVEEDELAENLFHALLWLYAAIVVTILVINNFLLRKIWRPFYQLIGQLQGFRLHSGKTFAPPATRVREFSMLNAAVVSLLEDNIKTYNSQKQFIENAAHELQTPLAISINKLELMAEQDGLWEDDMTMLAEVISSLERLTRLNKSLLLISRIENRQFSEGSVVDFNRLFRDTAADFAELAEYRHIRITITEDGVFSHRMDTDLAAVLAGNLLKNAVVHNTDHGTVAIHITGSGFSVANTGAAAALDPDRIFSRFYKASAAKGTTGLGLAIVKNIADLYRLRIVYSYNGMHLFTCTAV